MKRIPNGVFGVCVYIFACSCYWSMHDCVYASQCFILKYAGHLFCSTTWHSDTPKLRCQAIRMLQVCVVKCNVHWRSKITKYQSNTSGLFFLGSPRPAGTYNGRAQKRPRFPAIQKQFIQHHWERKDSDRFTKSGTQRCQPQKRDRAVFAERVTQTQGTLAVDLPRWWTCA